jgi:hypothetical protein
MVVYVEGGGSQKKKTLDDCRRGFGQLFEKVVVDGDTAKVVACGDRGSTFGDFRKGIVQGTEGFLILLVDSEGPVGRNVTPWVYLRTRDGWKKPQQARDDQAHFMVQCMESWFLADQEGLSDYYGQGFLINSLPQQADVEAVPKRDVERALDHASRHTQKGPYHKTRHGFELLANIDPAKVRAGSVHAQRLFELLKARAAM